MATRTGRKSQQQGGGGKGPTETPNTPHDPKLDPERDEVQRGSQRTDDRGSGKNPSGSRRHSTSQDDEGPEDSDDTSTETLDSGPVDETDTGTVDEDETSAQGGRSRR